MPIRPENRARYPDDWRLISLGIRKDRAGDRCECSGQCGTDHRGRCPEINGTRNSITGKLVQLGTAHLDDVIEHNDPDNLLALCRDCHLNYDRPVHIAVRRERLSRLRVDAAATRELFTGQDLGGAARFAQLRRRP